MVRVKVSTNLRALKVKTSQLSERGQYALINQVHADSNTFAPKLSGDMRTQSQVTSNNKQIIWNAPYARRQYYNQFTKYTTPGTGPKWFEKAKSIHLESWKRVAKAAMRL